MRRLAVPLSVIAVVALPAGASAATISLTSESGLVYQAAPGEVNALALASFSWPLAFTEYAAAVTVGPGCTAGTPILCGDPGSRPAAEISVTLGNRNDVATVNSYFGDTIMSAGNGDDEVLAGGLNLATVYGDAGDDTIRLAANNGTRGFGGSGDDRLTGGSGAYSAELDGGPGRDLLVPAGLPYNYAHGGPGRDTLVAPRGATRLFGEAGSDVVVALHSQFIEAGPGDDLVVSPSGGQSVSAGPGADRVDVLDGESTAPDTVSCGGGFDTVWADPADNVAADCESRRGGPAPQFLRATRAQARADALLAHRPDPSALAAR